MNMIKQIINKWFCCHEWTKLERVDTYSNTNATLPTIITIYYCCKKCGKFKKIVIKN